MTRGLAALLVLGALGCPPRAPPSGPTPAAGTHLGSAPARAAFPLTMERRDALRVLELDIARWTNVERLARSLPPLAWSEKLARAARAHSEEMARLGYFDHVSPVAQNRTLMMRVRVAGLDAPSLFVAENIARGTWRPHQARNIVQLWMESEGHRQNLLGPRHRTLGIGVARDGGGELVITQVFASTERP